MSEPVVARVIRRIFNIGYVVDLFVQVDDIVFLLETLENDLRAKRVSIDLTPVDYAVHIVLEQPLSHLLILRIRYDVD